MPIQHPLTRVHAFARMDSALLVFFYTPSFLMLFLSALCVFSAPTPSP